MRLPARSNDLLSWSLELIEECFASREMRRDQIQTWNSYFWTGTSDASQQAEYNRCYEHVDRLASFLFSPTDVRFLIEFDETEPKEVHDMARVVSRRVNREFHRHGLDLAFAMAVECALIDGCVLFKQLWGHDGPEGYVVHPQCFGVLREDIEDLDKQEAFVHRSYLTRGAFRRMIWEDPRREDIMKKIDGFLKDRIDSGVSQNDFFHQVVIGGTTPVSVTGQSAGAGKVGVLGAPQPTLDPKVAARLVPVDELWVLDDERQDYTTVRIAADEFLLEGKGMRRNLAGPGDTLPDDPHLKMHQPFTKICPNEVEGYFWGQSEIMQIRPLQDSLNEQLRDIRRMRRKIADNPRAFIGFAGMTAEKWRALKRPGGWAAEENPNAKIEKLADEIPESMFVALQRTLDMFDAMAGFTPIMLGQGEAGVRSNQQAATLTRNSGPRIRDRALAVERQCVEVGDFTLALLQAKDAVKHPVDTKGRRFLLDQLPDDARLSVDSHTASPAFSEDNERKAFALAKAGAIDAESLIMLTHPPHEDTLASRAREKAEAQAKMVQQHPELLMGGKRGGKK